MIVDKRYKKSLKKPKKLNKGKQTIIVQFP